MNSKLSTKANPKFQVNGVNHIALVCKDMKRTVEFYTDILGMPLIKTCALPDGGQHFFFDMGGASIAFFWFPKAPGAQPGIVTPATPMGEFSGEIVTAIGSMNHIAFDVSAELLPEYKRRLEAAGVRVSPLVHHNDVDVGFSLDRLDRTTWCSSIYFQDPDGIQLEFAGWTRAFDSDDVAHQPEAARS